MGVSQQSAHELFLSLLRTQKLLLASRAHTPRARADLDPAAYPVLFTLVKGPARISDLASVLHADLSVVSRQVSALAALGLVTKEVDPADGRAQLVALTARGRDVAQETTDLRAAWLQDLLGDWEPSEIGALKDHLDRLSDCFDDWLRSRGVVPPPAPSGPSPRET